MKKKVKLSDVLVNIVFYPFVVIALICTIGWFGMGIRPFITMSGSMEPAIHTGSICFVDTDYSYDDIVEGDIIAYETSTGDRVTHRVIEITPDGFVTQGDANDVADGLSTVRDNFVGKTLFSIPKVGYWVKSMQTPVVIGIFGVILFGLVAMSIIDAVYAKKEKNEVQSK